MTAIIIFNMLGFIGAFLCYNRWHFGFLFCVAVYVATIYGIILFIEGH